MRPVLGLTMMALLLCMWIGWRVSIAGGAMEAMLKVSHAELGADTPRDTEIEVQDFAELPAERALAVDVEVRAVPLMIAHRVARPSVTSVRERKHAAEQTLGIPEIQRAVHARPRTVADASPTQTYAYLRAASAYEFLAHGERREAVLRFREALKTDALHPQADQWRAELRSLERRWSLDGFALVRSGQSGGGGSALPTFGGSQYGVSARYELNPIASRQVRVIGRINATDAGLSEAAFGFGGQPFGRRGPEVALERRVSLGENGRDAFQLRVAGSGATARDRQYDLTVYADAGVAGASRRDLFASGQGFAGYRLERRVSLGAGAWGSFQDTGRRRTLVEAGPAARISLPIGDIVLGAEASYRLRLAGNAEQADGPALTVGVSY